MKTVSHAAKEIWNGALRAIGALLVTLLVGWLIVCIPAVKTWTLKWLLSLGAPERIGLTIFLGVSSVVLLGLWSTSQIALYKLRKRVQNKSLTLQDILGKKGVDKALDDMSKRMGTDNPWTKHL